jgi:hypothetical protein
MHLCRLIKFSCLAPALLLAAAAGSARAGSVTYNVSVNTSSLDGSSGYIDSQFNPGGSGALPATAAVSGFVTDGSLQSAAPLNSISGSVSGMLPATLTFSNNTIFNDYFEGLSFGNTINFALTLSGPAVGNSGAVGSSFAFSLYDGTGSTPLLTTDPNGSVLTINVNADGTTSVETFPQSPSDNTPVATATPVSTTVPEPSTRLVSVTALAVGFAFRRRFLTAKKSRSPGEL